MSWVKKAGLAATALATAGSLSTPLPASAAELDRIAGDSRYETSIEISKKSFPISAKTVYLARGDVFADALAGGSLTDGPVLLVPPVGSTSERAVMSRIAQLNPSYVVALGSAHAVSDNSLRRLAQGRTAGRLGGQNRFDTAATISCHAFPNGSDTVYFANGMTMADAVAGGTLSAGPVLPLPAPGQAIPSAIKDEVKRLNPSKAVALGGHDVVSNSSLMNAAPYAKISRLSGNSRYATAAAIAKHEFAGKSPNTVYLARGQVFADAVSGGSLTDGPIVLVDNNVDNSAAANVVQELKPKRVVALGGPAVISNQVLSSVTANTASTPSVMTTFEKRVFDLTNVERKKAGLPAFKQSTCLTNVARYWSNYQVGHGIYDHGDMGNRVWKACPKANSVGENIYKYPNGTPEQLVAGWMKSPGHRSNILDLNFAYLGVGTSRDGTMTTQNFSDAN